VEDHAVRDAFRTLLKEEDGQDLVEYSLLAALISIVCITVLGEIADAIVAIFTIIAGSLAGL
jgi:Flp pilus assembly pilin Flp